MSTCNSARAKKIFIDFESSNKPLPVEPLAPSVEKKEPRKKRINEAEDKRR